MTTLKLGDKDIVGLTEKIKILGPKKKKTVKARIDSGATMGSVDIKLAKELKLGPVIKKKKVKSAHGESMRPVIKMKLELAKRTFNMFFTIADRSKMKYKVLVGQNVLKKGFLIDPSRKV